MWAPSAASQYHGLINQGATCYLNSVLQVLFMTEDFREAVGRDTCDTECIDPHLASLFDDLTECEAYTYKITKTLGINNVYEQRDAAVYFEKILGLTSPEASQIFHGLLTDMTRCSTCGDKTEADGAFWHLPLALVDSNSEVYSVLDGIQTFFRASDFSGENQMYCEKCDAKSDATTKCVVKHHPEVLMLLLKRFEFNYHYMTYVKINRTVVVPYIVQIPENQMYELYAFVEHFGDLRGGHYTATVKPQDDERWHLFNDRRVSVCDYQPFQSGNLEESDSAYLLFYRKKTEVSSPRGFPPATSGFSEQDVMKRREREEIEKAAEVRQEPAVTFSIDKNEEPRTKDIVSVGYREVGRSPDPYFVVEDQDSGGYARQSTRDVQYRQDSHAEKQRNKGAVMMDGEKEMGGNAQAEKRETSKESDDNEDNDHGRRDGVRHRRPQESPKDEDFHSTDQMYKQEVSSMHPLQVCVYSQKAEERMGEQLERRRTEKHFGRDTEHEELVGVRQNLHENLGGKQEVVQDDDFKPVSVDKQEVWEMMEIDNEDDKDRKSVRGKLTITDLHYDGILSRGGDHHENMPKDNQRCKQEMSGMFYQKHERPRDVKGDEKRWEYSIAEKQTKEQESKRDYEFVHRRAESSFRPAGLTGSSRATENRGSDEKPQAKARNEKTMEGRSGSKPYNKLDGKIIDEETQNGVRRSIETKHITINPVAGTSQNSSKRWDYNEVIDKRKSDPKTDAKVTEGFCNLNLNDSPLPKPQKHRGKERPDAEIQAGKKHAKKERAKKKRHFLSLSPLKRNRMGKQKCNRTTRCWPFFWKSRKNTVHSSESD